MCKIRMAHHLVPIITGALSLLTDLDMVFSQALAQFFVIGFFGHFAELQQCQILLPVAALP
jgi:hypothetical protein